ncbi:MAG: hypothetical protein H0T89_24920 [Deltaproteobacteria bacterium]|nr:hypothetical protein [Deltaproteobacteria bacterium]
MRIACVHIPQFALQCVTRIDPSLRGAPVIVVGSAPPATFGQSQIGAPGEVATAARAALHSPVVQACSRAAWAVGVRIGMTATSARGLSPELRVVTADLAVERDTVRALADAVLGASPVIDIGGRIGPSGAHLAIYCEVPAKTRGTSFGDRLLERLQALGLTGRIGIADDRFTAWVAAWSGAWDPMAKHDRTSTPQADRLGEEHGVVSVPRGGSAAFLAPRPLSLLSITPEVLHMLDALGVSTLGEFAALPAPSVTRPFEADYQALARGESGNTLRPYLPDAPIREDAVVTAQQSAPAAIALIAERIALRLQGRGRCAARLEVTLSADAGDHVVPVSPLRSRDGDAARGGVLASAEELAEAIGGALGDEAMTPRRIRVVVTGEAIAGEQALADADLEVPAQRAITALTGSAATTTNHAGGSGRGELDTLAVVLSTTGSAVERVFGLTYPSAERRDGRSHLGARRRGKQRRRTRTGEALVQPRLFKM